MKYEKVTIEGNEYYKVSDHACAECHFYDPQEHCLFPSSVTTISCIDDPDDPMYVFMTEAELAKENIRKREEKLRNID